MGDLGRPSRNAVCHKLMQSLLGIIVFLFLAWLFSERRSEISWRAVLLGFCVHAGLAIMLLKVAAISEALLVINIMVSSIEAASREGIQFLFGYIGGGATPFEITAESRLFIFAFNVLPQVLVFTVIVALLWHWKILPLLVSCMGFLLSRLLGVRGPLATAGASSLFLGMVEAPLVVRAYLSSMTRSELFALMTLGMSTVAGSVLVLYASVLSQVIEAPVVKIVGASLMNILGAFYISHIFVPETDQKLRSEKMELSLVYDSTMDALATGTREGVTLAVNVGAMVLVLVSLVALVNGILSLLPWGSEILSLERIIGWICAPIAWLIGIPWSEANIAGGLLGTKIVLNELVAFIQLSEIGDVLSGRSREILVYALCGFANLGSLGILLGGAICVDPSTTAGSYRDRSEISYKWEHCFSYDGGPCLRNQLFLEIRYHILYLLDRERTYILVENPPWTLDYDLVSFECMRE